MILNMTTKLLYACLGFGLSTAIFVSVSAKADSDPRIVGDSGFLHEVESINSSKGLVCDGQFFWDKKNKEISCD